MLKTINSAKFTRWILVTLNCFFILSILLTQKPFATGIGERLVYDQVTQLSKIWPPRKITLMGVGASTYANYMGSQHAIPIEPLATVYGGKIEDGPVDMATLIERHNPDAVLVNDSLIASKNFDANSLAVLNSDEWSSHTVGTDTLYFRKKFIVR